MRKNTLIQTLAIGLSALFLGLSSVQAADAGIVQLIGPGSTVRSFQIDTAHVMQFGSRTQVRKASTAEAKQLKSLKATKGTLKSSSSATVSPVLRDSAGRSYGLPGGLIVTLKADVSEAEGRAQLESAGLTPDRMITPRVWVAKSPAGLETIEMANQANAKGVFADVSPNWWTRRALK